MSDETIDNDMTIDGENQAAEGHSDYKPVDRFEASAVHHLSGM